MTLFAIFDRNLKISKDLDKVTALEMSYGLNLSFRSPELIGEYSENNLAPSYFSFWVTGVSERYDS